MDFIIDDIFGEIAFNPVIINDSTEDSNTNTEVSTDDNPLFDEIFGDLSNIIILSDDVEDCSELTDTSNPIDPVATGIECQYEPISLDDSGDELEEFDTSTFDADEWEQYNAIKAYQALLKGDKDIKPTPIDKAEIAITHQFTEGKIFYNISPDYFHIMPWELDIKTFKHEYQLKRNPKYKFKKRLAMPVVFDTEYQTFKDEFKQYFTGRKKLNLTSQIRGIHELAPKKIYTHWDVVKEELPVHFPPLQKQDSCIFERYLRDNGVNVVFELKDSGIGEKEYIDALRRNVLQIPVFGHMLQADFMAMWQPKTPMYRYIERIISGRDKNNNLDGKKRLAGESDTPEILRPRIVIKDKNTGDKYALELIFYDSQSLHGIGKSLNSLATVTNTKAVLDDKGTYTKEQKERMLLEYLKCNENEAREKWIKYSVNSDLSVYQVFIDNTKQFYKLYTDEEIQAEKYFTLPPLTIGRAVANIIAARIMINFENDIFTDITQLASELINKYTEKSVTTHENRHTFIKELKKVVKHNNDYDEEIFKATCNCFSVKYNKVHDCYVVSFGLPDKLPKHLQQWIIATFCGGSSAMNIAGLSDTRRLNAKIQGGRCFRNRPLTIKDEGLIIDPDYDGAYSSFMRVLDLPMCANPYRIEYDMKANCKPLSVEQFRNKYKDELIPGMYQFFTSYTDETRNLINARPAKLNNPQDLLASYHPHHDVTNITSGAMWLEKTDTSYYYTEQLTNVILTHWQLQIIDTVFSKVAKQEILNSKIVTGIMYQKSDKLATIRDLLDGYQAYKGGNTYKIRGTKEIITRDNFRGWVGLNLGELIVTPVRKMRSKYPKKTPENEFYKLIGNTVYGVLCSKYFPVSNVVTANNITSGVRTGVWCLEKGLNSHNSITDGGLANALRVAFGRGKNKLTDKNTVQTHRLLGDTGVSYGVLGGYQNIEWTGINVSFCDLKSKNESTEELIRFTDSGNRSAYLDNQQAKSLIDNLIYKHLAVQFPKLDLFHLPFTDDNGNAREGILRIDCKGLVKECVVHGASNYLVKGGFHASYDKDAIKKDGELGKIFTAMRSYRKGYGSHAQFFMENLGEHPDGVDRSEVFDQSILLKVGLYQERYRSYFENSDYQVGDTFFMERLIREFPFSAYTFKNAEQRNSWKAEEFRLRGKYGQSIESFFVNDKGQIEYERMIQAFDMWIEAGYTCLADVFGHNKTVLRNAKYTQSHPEYENLKKRRESKRQAKR